MEIARKVPDYGATENESPQEQSPTKFDYVFELKLIWKDSMPLIVAFFLQYFLSVSPLLIVSRISAQALGAATLATMYMNIAYLGVIQGAVTAVDSFAPHAFGAGNYAMVGEVVQKNLAVNTILLVPMVALCWFSGTVLSALQPDPELASLAQTYLRIVTLGIPGLLIFEVGKRYLQAQNIFHASTYVLLLVSPLSLVLTYVFVFPFGWGYVGAPAVVVLSYWLMALLLVAYAVFVDGSRCWGGFSYRAMCSGLYDQIYLALFSLVSVEAEYFAFEVMALAAAYFGETALASQSICAAVGSLIFQVPFALSCSISTRVGSFIGAGNLEFARKSTNMCIRATVFLGICVCMLLLITMRPITRVFTDDSVVAAECYKILPVLFFTQCYDMVNVTCQGLLRSQRRQDVGSVFSLCSYYIFGCPLAYILAFRLNLQVRGLWIGLSTAVMLLTLAEVVLLARTNWPNIMELAKQEEHEPRL
ncbi:hypothetical protein KL949_002543 [Ogataea haglerorum]|nr:hypothetical protein KL913_005335 [Ogataea haglerorum]KAG7719551.1 hypothetical protein KL949_002543 [Ogataea haglerorum]KAG7767540.1 hypothetical protein KL931_003353 [Ogataea haglerorum]